MLKRSFDLAASILGLIAFGWLIVASFVLATVDTRRSGFFMQTRVGRNGKPFTVIKIRTMRDVADIDTTLTASGDPRVTPMGRFFRRTNLDELPQLINVWLGHMSFVGPRPDLPGFADTLKGADRIILTVRPGITGPATLAFRNEEALLEKQADPEAYNREVIWPEKVRLNRAYVESYRFREDLRSLARTLLGP